MRRLVPFFVALGFMGCVGRCKKNAEHDAIALLQEPVQCAGSDGGCEEGETFICVGMSTRSVVMCPDDDESPCFILRQDGKAERE